MSENHHYLKHAAMQIVAGGSAGKDKIMFWLDKFPLLN
jgi:hypothetical protein